ncbi:MAG: fructosamine kinase family protein, partial [Bacteriovoracia bacterium]
ETLNSNIILGSSVGGGCIADARSFSDETGKKYFYKSANGNAMFVKEAHGLEELDKAKAIRVPEVICYDNDFLVLEWIEGGAPKKDFFKKFGKAFAKLHKYYGEEFGFFEDNFIGSSIQKNTPPCSSWIEFYYEHRLMFQLKLLQQKNKSTPELEKALEKLRPVLKVLLQECDEEPSLLHGDLWSGNYMIDASGEASLIDPAVYYGHREADLAMTKLFGGFSNDFYKAYQEEYPLQDGYQKREPLYKLYHILNHYTLFGGGYYSQAMSILNHYI